MSHLRTSALAMALAAVAATYTADSPAVAGDWAPLSPTTVTEVYPNVGDGSSPAVRVERIRRAGQTDRGLLNFEMTVHNRGSSPIELASVTHSTVGGSPLAPATHDAFENVEYLRTGLGFAPRGVVYPEHGLGYLQAVANDIVVLNYYNDESRDAYIAVGRALSRDGDTLYAAAYSPYSGALRDEITWLPGWQGEAMAATRGAGSEILVAGRATWLTDVITLTRLSYDTNSKTLELDDTFGYNGVAFADIPQCTGERPAAVSRVSTRYFVVGTATCSGLQRTFVARFDSQGLVDSFGDDGVMLLPNPFGLDSYGVDLRWRAAGFHVLSRWGGGCDAEEAGQCYALVTRIDMDSGALDPAFGGSGMRLYGFPDSAGLHPVGFAQRTGLEMTIVATVYDGGNGSPGVGAIRLLDNGDVDPAFAGDGYLLSRLDGLPTRPRAAVHRGMDFLVSAVVDSPASRQVGILSFDFYGNPEAAETNRQIALQVNAPTIGGMDRGRRGTIIVGSSGADAQLTRFRPDDLLDWHGVIDPAESQELFWMDARELPTPFSAIARTELDFEGFAGNVVIEADLIEDAMVLPMPFGENAPDERYWVSAYHRLDDHHRPVDSQRYAYDLGMQKLVAGVWRKKPSGSKTNEEYYVWGKPVFAARGGRVVSCWSSAADNPAPYDKSVFEAGGMPGGGNMFIIEHDDGSQALYAHFQEGGVNLDICPVDCADYDSSEAWHGGQQQACSGAIDPQLQPEIAAGTWLGLIGNSGNSTGPHLHFHVADGPGGSGLPLYFDHTWVHHASDPPWWMPAALAGTAAPYVGNLLDLTPQ